MAKDVKFVISASAARAEEEIRRLQATGGAVADRLGRDFENLGIRSSLAIEKEKAAVVASYDKIKASGVASAEEIRRAHTAMEGKLHDLSNEAKGVEKNVRGIGDGFSDLRTVIGMVGAGMLLRDVVQARAELDKINNSMQAATGGKLQGSAEFAFVRGEADRLGLSLKSAASDYTKLAASSRGTVLEGEQTRKIFSAIAAASTVMGLSADDTSGAITALTQMISKGTVQSEELKGQLAERLPGALQTTASALGVSTQKLQQMLENGEVMATDMLPKLAAELQKTFGKQTSEAAHSTRSELNRLETAIFDLKTRAASGDALPKMIGAAATSAEVLGKHLDIAAAGLVGLTGAATIMGIQALVANIGKLAAVSAVGKAGLFGLAFAGGYAVGDWINHKFDLGGVRTKEEELLKAEAAQNRYNEAIRKAQEYINKMKAAEEVNLKQVQKLTSAFQEYEKTIGNIGKLEMEYAKGGFSQDLARQAEYLQKNNTLAANLSAPLQSYLAVIEQSYSSQVSAEKAIGQALFRIGAEQRVIAEQNVQIAKVEKAAAAERLAAWSQYYDNLKNMHSVAMETMKKRQAELTDIKMTTSDLTLQLQQKLMTPLQQYYSTIASLAAKEKMAAQMDSDEKIKLLQQVQQQYASLTNEIKDGDAVAISQSEAVNAALYRIKSVGAEIEKEKASQIGAARDTVLSLEQAMTTTANTMEAARQQVIAIDNQINALTRTFALTMNDQASPVVDKVKAALAEIRDKTITITAIYQQSYMDPGLSPGYQLPSYDVGTPYVPRDMIAKIHKGERIVTAADNARSNYGRDNSIVVQGGINVTISDGSGSVTAAKIAREIYPELQKLARRQAA